MKSLLIALITLSTVNAYSVEMLDFQVTSGAITKVDQASFEKIWASNTPACIKDGGRVLKQNKAFAAKGLKKSECSDTPKAKAKQELLGYTVVKFSVETIPAQYAKQAMGLK